MIFSLNSFYFLNSDFSNSHFGKNMSDVFFEGCNLYGADMSQTTQSNLYLAGATSYFLVKEIMTINNNLKYPDQPLSQDQFDALMRKM